MIRDELLRRVDRFASALLASNECCGLIHNDEGRAYAARLSVAQALANEAAVDAHLAKQEAPASCSEMCGGLRCEKPAGHNGNHFAAGDAGRDLPQPVPPNEAAVLLAKAYPWRSESALRGIICSFCRCYGCEDDPCDGRTRALAITKGLR